MSDPKHFPRGLLSLVLFLARMHLDASRARNRHRHGHQQSHWFRNVP